jgi:hypothetical protein
MKVISFVSKSFVPLLEAWDAISGRVLGDDTEIYCMDDAAHAELEPRHRAGSIACRPLQGTAAERQEAGKEGLDGASRQAFWLRRFSLLRAENLARDFVHSDLDAFWLEDLRPVLEAHPADLVFSNEFGLPREAVEAWGFSLCCGLFSARSTPAAQAFFKVWNERTKAWRDDQKALNHLLLDWQVAWEDSADPAFEKEARLTVAEHELHIAVLRQDRVRRAPPIDGPGTAASIHHPFFDKLHFQSYVAAYAALATWPMPRVPAEALAARSALEGRLKPRRLRDLALLDAVIATTESPAPIWFAHRAWLLHEAGQSDEALPDIRTALARQDGQDDISLSLTGLMIANAVGDRPLARRMAERVGAGLSPAHPRLREALREMRKARAYRALLGVSGLMGWLAMRKLPMFQR